MPLSRATNLPATILSAINPLHLYLDALNCETNGNNNMIIFEPCTMTSATLAVQEARSYFGAYRFASMS